MTHDEIAVLLAKCASIDQRTVGRADVLSWHELLGHLDFGDAREAVKRWYAAHRDRIMPADIIEGCRTIRNERHERQQHEIRALPSRFEADEVRDERIQRGVRELAQRWAMPEKESSEPIRERALERARRDRKGREATTPKRHRGGGPGIPLEKVTKGPDWADPGAREAESIRALHAAGRHCGRGACPRCAALADAGQRSEPS